MNDPEITRKSPGNHPVITPFSRLITSTLLLLFTFAIGNVWGATETVNKTKDNWTGTSCTLTHSECANGSADSQKDGDASNVTYIKFRTNKNSNTMTFNVVEGYKVTGFYFRAYTNDNTTSAVLTSIQYDADDAIVLNATIPTSASKTEGTTYVYNNTTSEATSSIVLQFDNSGKQIMAVITITYEEIPSGPVDPVFTYTPATYTIGDPALDLSTKVTSTNTTGAITFAVSTADAGTTGVSIADDKNFTATTAGIAKVTVSQAASTGYNAKSQDIEVSVVAPAPAACPEGLSISGTKDYTEGETISLTAALSEGNGEITYTWYKGDDLATAKAAGSIGTGASFSKASCTTDDAGNYYCVASKDACLTDAESAAYAVTVAEKTCPTSGELYTMTMKSKSLSGVTQNTEVALAGDYATEEGGVSYIGNKNTDAGKAQIKTDGGGIVYFNGNDAYVKIVLDCPLKADDKITFVPGSGTRQVCFTTTNTRTDTYQTSSNTFTVSSAFLATAADPENVTTLYVWRIGSSTYLHSLTITRPYNVTFVSEHGTAPTTPTKALSFTLTELSDASFTHTGWTADKAVKVGGETKAASTALAVDATVELTDNTTFTATWEAKAATFAVTYKANNGTEEADINDPAASTFAANTFTIPDGKMFAGWNTQADGEGTNYAVGDAVTEDIAVYAKWVVDPTIRLILKSGDTYSINTDKFTVYEGTELQNEEYTVDGRAFAKNFKFGGTCSSTPFAGQAWSNKFMAYDVTSNSTDIKLYIYNKNSSNKKLYYQIVPEGSAAAAFQSVTITSKATNQVVSIPTITAAKGARVLFGIESTDVRICQIEVLENGTALPAFGTNGYEFSVPGRAATNNKTGAFDGFVFKTNADLRFISGQDYIALRNIDGSQYVKFTVATNIQLQVTTPNANKFYVGKTAAGDAEKDAQYGGSAAAHNVNLHAGTYYIAPTTGSSDGEVQITKLAFATAPAVKTVTFDSDGGSSVKAQEVFAGEKAVEPTTPTKDGYRFVEWQYNSVKFDFANTTVSDNITLNAVWQKTWTVTFNADNGSDLVVVTVDNNQAVAQPTNPEKSGFDFVEWQLNGSTYDFATLVTNDIELNAHWVVAQDDASLSALSYSGNAIDVESAEDVSGVQTYTYHLPWGSTIDPALVSVTKNAESATMNPINYDSENKQATFQVTSGNGLVSINYAIQFVIDAKRGTSIVKATTNNVVTGLIGGTIDQSYSGNANSRKLNKGNYFGVTLANDETFQEGDVFIVNIATAADLGKFMVFADKNRTELIADQGIVYTKPDVASPVVCPTGEMMLVLPAAANGKKSLYLSREDGTTQWNPVFSYVEVTREMNPAIKSFKFGDDAATINESAKTITYEVAYGTDVTALTPTVEAYGNNGATYTPDGATDFTTSVNYVVTDAYGELSTTYAVTVNVAAPSENAYLASLSVAGYVLDFNKEVESYNIVLDYGTTVLPEITYAVEDAGLATAVKAEGGVDGATTITVTPQAGAGYEKVYTINFSVSTTPKFVIYDGSTMIDYAESGSDVSTGFAWTVVGGNHSGKNAPTTLNGKTYQTAQNIFTSPTKGSDAGNTRYIEITIPDGYLAKFYLAGATNSSGTLRSSYISKEKIGTLDQSIAYVSTDLYAGVAMKSGFQLPGTYYYCADASIRLYELSVQLYPIDYSRATTEGRYGTICLPNGGIMVGAELYEVAYFGETSQKVFLDNIINGEMEAGRPYIFLPKEGTTQLAVFYTDEANAPQGDHNGLIGFIGASEDEYFDIPAGEGNYILQNNYYREVPTGAWARIKSNRAYIKLSAIDPHESALAPGRRRISMSVYSEQVATGVEDVQGDNVQCTKVLINGELFIIRGEKMYDAKGQLVK